MNSKEALIALNLLPNIGPVRIQTLLSAFSSPEKVLTAMQRDIERVPGFGPELAKTLTHWEEQVDLTHELHRCRELGVTVITQQSPEYPPLLRQIYAPPIVLYVWGNITEKDHQALSIVGSRRTTSYGRESAKKFSFQLAYAGLTIVSGLARGIDTAAHEGSLAAHGRTIAILGSGIGKLYPSENRALAEKIAQSGAVVSEFPIDYPPDKQTFPLRNRLVSGWSHGLLVVEAPARSGALITASQALEQGRSLFAIPGQINRPLSQGTNRLIQEGAQLVLDSQDILDAFNLFNQHPNHQTPPLPQEGWSREEQLIYQTLQEEELQIDTIIAQTGLSSSVVSSTLLVLEMRKVVKQLPGKVFCRV